MRTDLRFLMVVIIDCSNLMAISIDTSLKKGIVADEDMPGAARTGFEFADGEFKGLLFKSADLKLYFLTITKKQRRGRDSNPRQPI